MSIAIGATKDALANDYATLAPYGALFTGDPGTTGAATNETTGGSPAYARKAISWSTASGGTGVVTGAPTFDVASGQTITYAGVCESATKATADVVDKTSVTSQAFASQGTFAVTFTYTQS